MATIDLKTLPKWKELTYGNHTLQIVARAPEHSDSEKSATEQIKVGSVSTETVTEVQATFA